MNISFFPWTGGKLRVVDILYPLFPDYKSYYEPFIGSGAVLLNKQKKGKEIVNDLDRDLYTLHKVMAEREKVHQLMEIFQTQPLTEEAFEEAKKTLKNKEKKEPDDIERARCKFLLNELSYNAMGKHYSGYNGADFGAMVAWKFPIICDRYQNVEFRNQDGIALMEEAKKDEDAFVFADPPYVQSTRANPNIYACEMTDENQIKLLETIKDAKCKIMLCGYAGGDNLYDRELFPCGWKRYKLADLVHSCSRTTKKKKGYGEEFIWVNYELPKCAGYFINLGTEVSAATKVAA